MIKIGDRVFEVPPPRGMKSFALQQRVLPVAGRIVSVLLHFLGVASGEGAEMGSILDRDITSVLPQVMPYVGEIFAQMPAGELESITRELLCDATCDRVPLFGSKGGGDAFDVLMQGRTVETWQLLWHALGVWYPDFFALGQRFVKTPARESGYAVSST